VLNEIISLAISFCGGVEKEIKHNNPIPNLVYESRIVYAEKSQEEGRKCSINVTYCLLNVAPVLPSIKENLAIYEEAFKKCNTKADVRLKK